MLKTAQGKFEIKSTPIPSSEALQTIGAMSMVFEKKFEGALNGTSLVSMMGLMNKDLGSGAYVALERITCELGGREGSFCLQHSSTMARGEPAQFITVIPDSATGDLEGLTGGMKIEIRDGQHFYTFEYTLD